MKIAMLFVLGLYTTNALRLNHGQSAFSNNRHQCNDPVASFTKSLSKGSLKDCKALSDYELGKTLPLHDQIANVNVWETWHHDYLQSDFRLQQAMKNWMSKDPNIMSMSARRRKESKIDTNAFTIAILGGSISAGKGCGLESNWVSALSRQLPHANYVNLAIPASDAGTVVARWKELKNQLSTADLIIVEYNYNDGTGNVRVRDERDNHELNISEKISKASRQNEAMMHLLFSLPQNPAVLYFDLPGPAPQRINPYPTFEESMHINVSKAFGIPIVWYADIERQVGSQLWVSANGYARSAHPDCNTHDIMAWQMHQVLQKTMGSVCEHGVQGSDPPLPPLQNEFDYKCAQFSQLSVSASMGQGAFPKTSAGEWAFKEDVKGKPGWIAPIGALSEIVFSGLPIELGGLKVEYLRTYENIGSVECKIEKDKAVIKSIKLEGLWEACVSLTSISQFSDIPKGIYDLRCRSDGAKFKITGLMTC